MTRAEVYGLVYVLAIIVGSPVLVAVAVSSGEAGAPYYWLEEGAYFRYEVFKEGDSWAVFRDLESGYHVRVNLSRFFIEWRVLSINGDWMRVELSYVFPRSMVLNTSEPVDYRVDEILLVNVKTMQVYINWEGRLRWAWEWPFMLRPDQGNGTVKMFLIELVREFYGFGVPTECYRNQVLPVFREMNKTIVRASGGKWDIDDIVKVGGSEDPLIQFNRIPPGWSRYTDENVGLAGLVMFFLWLKQPADTGYKYSGIELGEERLVEARDAIRARGVKVGVRELAVDEAVWESFKRLYLTLPQIKGAYNIACPSISGEGMNGVTLIVGDSGEVYAVMPLIRDIPGPERLLYDSVSGILVYAKLRLSGSYNMPYMIFLLGIDPVRIELVESDMKDFKIILGERRGYINAEIYLVETNIDLQRPTLGGIASDSKPEETPSREENEGSPHYTTRPSPEPGKTQEAPTNTPPKSEIDLLKLLTKTVPAKTLESEEALEEPPPEIRPPPKTREQALSLIGIAAFIVLALAGLLVFRHR